MKSHSQRASRASTLEVVAVREVILKIESDEVRWVLHQAWADGTEHEEALDPSKSAARII